MLIKQSPGKQDFAQTVLNQCDSCQPATVQGQGKRSFGLAVKSPPRHCQRLALMVPTSTNLPLATENQHATGCAKTRRSLHGTLSTPKGLSEQNSLGKETNQGMNLPAEREQDQDVLGYVTK